MALDLILGELQPFELSHFMKLFGLYGMVLCNYFLPQFSMNVSQTCRHIVDILKICMWILD